MTSRLRGAGVTAVLAATFVLLAAAAGSKPPGGGFTREQVQAGELVYIGHCLVCHGSTMQGVQGPPLLGPQFLKSLATGKMTTPELYAFISSGMPQDAPGSLTQQQYLNVLAYILNKNGIAPGAAALSTRTLARVALPRAPGLAPNPAAELTAAPTPGATVPAAARVNFTDAMLSGAGSDGADWPAPGRTYDNTRYSPLAQIGRGNVASLQPVAMVHTGMTGSFETTPLVVSGVMYLTTPVVQNRMKIMALDATNGAVLWSTSYALGPFKICCGPNNRGLALAYGNLYVGTLDAKLVAFDARTGSERWETRVADPSLGYSESMAPQVYDGNVIIGSAGGEWALRGFVASYDARTGKQRWRWYSTDPKTFAGDSWKTGGGTVWTTPAIDPVRKLLIFGTGNPNPDLNGASRAGDNLYTDSIVALDIVTGKLRWYYQEVKHDLWDYDATSNVVLFDVRANGRMVPAVGQAGKVGWFFIVDRRTGKLLRKSQPFVLQNKNMFATKRVLPGANGGSEWSPPAYSPQTHNVYVLGINQLMDFKISPATDHPGFAHTGSVFTNVSKPKIQTGTFTAIDVDSGRISWQYKAPKPMIGGALATGGGLVFVGEGNGQFDAFDASSGRKLWHYTFVGGANAPPVSYEVNGTQYIAVAAGGNYQLNYERDDTVGIFALKR